MHVTTVRFGDDLWERLEREAAADGVSIAQFVRDAALLRVAGLAARRGDHSALVDLQELAAHEPRRRHRRGVHDAQRLAAVRATRLLDGADPALDRIAALTRRVLNVPVALVSLVDEERQAFPGCTGLGEPWASQRGTPLSHSFCRHVVEDRAPLIVSDARTDPRLEGNLAIRDLDVVAYAGVPLVDGGEVLGSLCAIDTAPRHWTADQVELLESLAESALTEIRQRAAALAA